MQKDVLIVGGGISGVLLSWFLKKRGLSLCIIDNDASNSPSKVAAGIINPVTGRRYSITWMIDELLPFAMHTYRQIEEELNIALVQTKTIIDFFPSAQMRNAFVERLEEGEAYLSTYADQNFFNPFFQYDFGCGEIKPCAVVNVAGLIKAWKEKLMASEEWLSQSFVLNGLKLHANGIAYENIEAKKIIFCDGLSSAHHPFFQLLPFAASKGEALVIECRDLPTGHIFKKGMMLAPLQQRGMFWVGSNYLWEFEDDKPSQAFYAQATHLLNGWLKLPYKVLEHRAALRPSTLERRPFVGFHPVHRQVGILNGMGTKGTSLAPWFAQQLAQHIATGEPIQPEADVQRFKRILSKDD